MIAPFILSGTGKDAQKSEGPPPQWRALFLNPIQPCANRRRTRSLCASRKLQYQILLLHRTSLWLVQRQFHPPVSGGFGGPLARRGGAGLHGAAGGLAALRGAVAKVT